MYAFLIITALSLAFYLFLLAALYRDGRKRRTVAGQVRRVDFASSVEFDSATRITSAAPARRQSNSARVLVRFAKPAPAEMLKSRAMTAEPVEVITLAPLPRGKNELQCS